MIAPPHTRQVWPPAAPDVRLTGRTSRERSRKAALRNRAMFQDTTPYLRLFHAQLSGFKRI